MNLTFNLCAGTWRWWFREKETKKPLTSITIIHLFKNETELSVLVPDELKENKKSEVYIERVR